jgi:protein-arginine kinase activator protein McsA
VVVVLDVVCEECGEPFQAKTQRARFCSTAHRVRANRRPDKVGQAKADADEAAATPAPRKRAGAKKAPAKKAAAKRSTTRKTKATEKPAAPSTPPAPTYDTLAEQVKQSLTDLQALGTISGMAAVRVAQQIDRGRDSGAAVATLSRELSRLVGEAKVESAPNRRDKVDDIADRAAAKIAAVRQLAG